jgi:hypothetical protein
MDGIINAQREGNISGLEAVLLKKLFNGNTKEPFGATLVAFNKLMHKAQDAIFAKRPDLLSRIVEKVDARKIFTGDTGSIRDALLKRQCMEGAAGDTVRGLKRATQMLKLFRMRDNKTQDLLLNCESKSEIYAILDELVARGEITANDRKHLEAFVALRAINREKRDGHINAREAGLLKKAAQGYTKNFDPDRATFKAFAKVCRSVQILLFHKCQLTERSSVVYDSDSCEMSLAKCPSKLHLKLMQKNMEFSRNLHYLRRTIERVPLYTFVEGIADGHDGHFECLS